jgi:hypothetical protein
MNEKQGSTTTSSMDISDTPAARAGIGRPAIGTLAAAVTTGRLSKEDALTDSKITGGMSVKSQLPEPTAKPVDANHLEGSNPGDHRIPAKDGATGALDTIKNAPGPRDPAQQFKNTKNSKAGAGGSFQSTVPVEEVGD